MEKTNRLVLISILFYFILSLPFLIYSQDTYLVGTGNFGSGSIFAVKSDGTAGENWFEMVRSQDSEYCELVESNGKLWGMTTYGGANGLGLIFSIESDGSDYTKVHDFDGVNGAEPRSRLIESNGKLWGTTYVGGTNDRGVIFSYDLVTGTYQKVHDFDETNGSFPLSGLTESNGNLWGVTTNGGTDDSGVIYRIQTNGSGFTKIHDFNSITNGSFPLTDFVENSGELFGTVAFGGTNSDGAIFAINTSTDEFRLVFEFDDDVTGERPFGSLVESGGKFWGLTSFSPISSNGRGTIYNVNIDGTEFTTVHDFVSDEGATLRGALVESNGRMWGIAPDEGANKAGSIFSVKTDGTEFRVDHAFDIANDARTPFGGLIENDGRLLGISKSGGSFGNGAIYSINNDGTSYSVVHNFDDAIPTGSGPTNDLVQIGEKIYGTNRSGGANGYGGIFHYDLSDGSYVQFHDFDYTNGSSPIGGLVWHNNRFFGTTSSGGLNDAGVLFSIDPEGTDFQKLYDFTGDEGSQQGGLSVIGDKLWGDTFGGGGALYSINFDGSEYTVIRRFNITNEGTAPTGKLLLDNGLVWGTSQGGGPNRAGNIYTIKPDGTEYTIVHDFDSDNGALPNGLIKVNDKFFGMTRFGGTNSRGVIYSITTAGTDYTVVHSFSSGTGTSFHRLVHAEGKIWGITNIGGVNDTGFIFRLDEDGSNFTILKNFDDDFGGNPGSGGLLSIMLKQRQEISFDISAKTYGDTDFTLTATSNTSNPISYASLDSDILELSGTSATIKAAGEVIVTASQEADDTFYSRTVEKTLAVNKAALEATAGDITINEGDPLPTYSISYSGFVNGESVDVIDTPPAATSSVIDTNTPGTFDIVLEGGTDNNYEFDLNNGVLTINNVLSIESLSKLVKLFPNPTSGQVTIDAEEELEFLLFDLKGKNILKSKGVKELNFSNFDNGTYLLRIVENGETLYTQKIIKQ